MTSLWIYDCPITRYVYITTLRSPMEPSISAPAKKFALLFSLRLRLPFAPSPLPHGMPSY